MTLAPNTTEASDSHTANSVHPPADLVYRFIVFIPTILIPVLMIISIKPALPDMIEVWIPVHDLPIYHFILDSDVEQRKVNVVDLPFDETPIVDTPVGAYTRQPLRHEQVILEDQIISVTSDWDDVTVVSIPKTPSTAFGGHLEAGMVMGLWRVDSVSEQSIRLSDVLILDATTEVVIAVPSDTRDAILPYLSDSSLFLTL